MKKLYRKGSVHPSPQIKPQDQLSLLPATILSLTALLSPEDREVLSYLISSAKNPDFFVSSGKKKNRAGRKTEHPPLFHCDCFNCYMSFWIRWDSSPNRQLIHEIIEAFEDGLENEKKIRKDRRKKRKSSRRSAAMSSGELTRSNESSQRSGLAEDSGNGAGGDVAEEENGSEKGSIRRIVSFIADRIFGAWR